MNGQARAQLESSLQFLQSYRPPIGVTDELLQRDGSLRPVWRPLIELLASQSPEAMARRMAAGDQYLNDAGVYFRQLAQGVSTERAWPLSHIPVVIAGAEWQQLAEGIAQRAELLEQVMADLYGPARLVREGLLPAELIARNSEWLRPLVGVQPPGGHYLHFLAFEIGRSPDGGWFVLGDRTQAPSGAGFALENRMATSRVFFDHYPNANVERLAGFFRGFRDALNDLRQDMDGRVAILTPGQETDTYFEHAYIARYLGFMLLEGEDIKAERGRLNVRTISGPEPISVMWRRLDSRFADPLELDETSAIGTPGMVSTLRDGAATIVNALGSGVLEARALLAFLPRISEVLTGAPLKLPNIATWWCGQPQERAYVKSNLARMIIGPALSTQLPFDADSATFLGGSFRTAARPSIEEWLVSDGAGLVGQESVSLSTTPALVNGSLVPRPMTVRVFAARTSKGWIVMPGGYARIGQSDDPTALSMQKGGSVADVWVIGEKPVVTDSLSDQPQGPFVRRMPGILPSRAADNLYWLGRYVERAEGVIRLVRAYNRRLAETGDPDQPLLAALAQFLDRFGTDVSQPVPENVLNLLDFAQNCAGKIRDRFSIDGWSALADLSRTVRDMSRTARTGDDAARAMSVLLRKLAGFSGLVHDNMFHFMGWRFLTIGRALERADRTSAFLAEFADVASPPGGFDLAVEVGDSVMTHRRRYAVETNRSTVIDLLALDINNPRSILFQLEQISRQDAYLPKSAVNGQMSPFSRTALRLHTELSVATPDEVNTARLWNLRDEIATMSNDLTHLYLD